MNLYLDASALVKRYVEEAGSNDVLDWMDAAEIIGMTLVTRAEVAAAIMRASRLRAISPQEIHQSLVEFRGEWFSFQRLPVTEDLVARADRLACEFGLARLRRGAFSGSAYLEGESQLSCYAGDLRQGIGRRRPAIRFGSFAGIILLQNSPESILPQVLPAGGFSYAAPTVYLRFRKKVGISRSSVLKVCGRNSPLLAWPLCASTLTDSIWR